MAIWDNLSFDPAEWYNDPTLGGIIDFAIFTTVFAMFWHMLLNLAFKGAFEKRMGSAWVEKYSNWGSVVFAFASATIIMINGASLKAYAASGVIEFVFAIVIGIVAYNIAKNSGAGQGKSLLWGVGGFIVGGLLGSAAFAAQTNNWHNSINSLLWVLILALAIGGGMKAMADSQKPDVQRRRETKKPSRRARAQQAETLSEFTGNVRKMLTEELEPIKKKIADLEPKQVNQKQNVDQLRQEAPKRLPAIDSTSTTDQIQDAAENAAVVSQNFKDTSGGTFNLLKDLDDVADRVNDAHDFGLTPPSSPAIEQAAQSPDPNVSASAQQALSEKEHVTTAEIPTALDTREDTNKTVEVAKDAAKSMAADAQKMQEVGKKLKESSDRLKAIKPDTPPDVRDAIVREFNETAAEARATAEHASTIELPVQALATAVSNEGDAFAQIEAHLTDIVEHEKSLASAVESAAPSEEAAAAEQAAGSATSISTRAAYGAQLLQGLVDQVGEAKTKLAGLPDDIKRDELKSPIQEVRNRFIGIRSVLSDVYRLIDDATKNLDQAVANPEVRGWVAKWFDSIKDSIGYASAFPDEDLKNPDHWGEFMNAYNQIPIADLANGLGGVETQLLQELERRVA